MQCIGLLGSVHRIFSATETIAPAVVPAPAPDLEIEYRLRPHGDADDAGYWVVHGLTRRGRHWVEDLADRPGAPCVAVPYDLDEFVRIAGALGLNIDGYTSGDMGGPLP